MAKNRTNTIDSIANAAKSWRFGAVTLLSLSSGAPLGLVLVCVPAWLATAGIDIKTIGLVTLAQAPYAFKFVWAPILDRFSLPIFGHKRGWIFFWQLLLALLVGILASYAVNPQVAAIAALTLLIAFASASQDIAIDAYAVESLRPDEQGLAAGSRTALYRIGMWLAGNISITLWPYLGWQVTLLCQALIFFLLLPVTIFAPEPENAQLPPRSLRAAIWEPFVGFFSKSSALQIAGFILLYKLADNLAMALIRPFLIEKGYNNIDVGIASGTISLGGIMFGTFLGGALTISIGLGRSLWIFGFMQALSGLGYAVVASIGISRPIMYTAMAIESTTVGLATGALDVLLLRLTDKRFSATQFALLSSIFAIGRTVVGPIAGFVVDAIGWREFFIFTVFCAAPGLIMLRRFAPLGAREIIFNIDSNSNTLPPLSHLALFIRGLLGCFAGIVFAASFSLVLKILKALHDNIPLAKSKLWQSLISPTSIEDWLAITGYIAFGLVIGFAAAAYCAARRHPLKNLS
ncbi:MAG: MFS transporter [Deltaproteobacteria bacterium]|nr:MFS transporter [Deltaproteobacteria bacterium]